MAMLLQLLQLRTCSTMLANGRQQQTVRVTVQCRHHWTHSRWPWARAASSACQCLDSSFNPHGVVQCRHHWTHSRWSSARTVSSACQCSHRSFKSSWSGAVPPSSDAQQVAMGMEGIKRMAEAFQICEAQQPFTGHIVGHCSSGLLVHGAGITGQA